MVSLYGRSAHAAYCIASEKNETARMTEMVLDLRGLHCPHLVLWVKKALPNIPVGSVLVLECPDLLRVIDIPHFVNQTGQAVQARERRGSLDVLRIVKLKA
jgi:tRNA 2-thiouridine synthesizing protein A